MQPSGKDKTTAEIIRPLPFVREEINCRNRDLIRHSVKKFRFNLCVKNDPDIPTSGMNIFHRVELNIGDFFPSQDIVVYCVLRKVMTYRHNPHFLISQFRCQILQIKAIQ